MRLFQSPGSRPLRIPAARFLLHTGVVLLGVLGALPLAKAQGVPTPQIDPGSISTQNRNNEQQIREQSDQTLQGPAVVPVPRAETIIAPEGGQRFALKGVMFDTSAFLSKEELDAIIQPFVGTQVDISQIQRILKAVNDLYSDKGIVTASAILPPQDFKDGILHITLIEGKLGKLVVKGSNRLHDDFILGHFHTMPGSVVDVPELTRNVGAFNKTGVAQIQASLQPGASFGLSDIQLAVIEPPAVSVQLFGDNQGVESVGKYEGGFLIQGYAPLGIDDRLTVYGVGSQGNLDGNIAYSVPFDLSGGRVGGSYTKGRIYVVQGPFSSLNIKGKSDAASANAVQPIFVDANWFFLANGSLTQSVSSSTQSDIQTTNNRTSKETVGFSVGYSNPTFSVSVSPTYSNAETNFDVTGTVQNYSLYNGTFSASVRLPVDFFATLGGAFQVSSASLIAGDQLFQIGGPTTVRGYTTSFAAGATGYYANLELHHNLDFLTTGLDAFAFYDRGSVYSTSPAVVTLNSVGAGLSYDFNKRIFAEVSVGVPLNHLVSNQPPVEVYFRLTTKFSSSDLSLL